MLLFRVEKVTLAIASILMLLSETLSIEKQPSASREYVLAGQIRNHQALCETQTLPHRVLAANLHRLGLFHDSPWPDADTAQQWWKRPRRC